MDEVLSLLDEPAPVKDFSAIAKRTEQCQRMTLSEEQHHVAGRY